MNSRDLVRILIRESIRSSTYEMRSGKVVEYGSDEHIDELDRIQKAVEAMRFLKRKAKRQFDRNLLVTD